MVRMIDQIRASRLPSNMMQFAARGALQVPPAENIEILVYLAKYNKVFGDLARMTLAGWDEKACRAAVSDPQTPQEVLNYFIASENLRPTLLADLLENPSLREEQIVKLATSALRGTIDILLQSPRARASKSIVAALKSNPYVKKEEAQQLENSAPGGSESSQSTHPAVSAAMANAQETRAVDASGAAEQVSEGSNGSETTFGAEDESVFAYLKEHSEEITAEGEKPFQAIGGLVETLLGDESSSDSQQQPAAEAPPSSAPAAAAVKPHVAHGQPKPGAPPKRENTLQKINSLDVKGRIQLALKGNKEERSILIRDGTKVVALAVLEAPKLSDGEVEKFASQKNVLEAVLRQIPLKRRFMKNYIVVRNLVANPRTPLDLSLGLMKNLLIQDLKNLSSNKEVSETIRKLALKMYKQKLEAANKK